MPIQSVLNSLAGLILALDKRDHLGPYPGELMMLALDLTEAEWSLVVSTGIDYGYIGVNVVNATVFLTDAGRKKARDIAKILND